LSAEQRCSHPGEGGHEMFNGRCEHDPIAMVIRNAAHSRGLVLVAEDNDGMRKAIDTLLDAAGFSSIAYSSAEALIAGGREDELCVISNIRLPGMSGFELLSKLRERGTPTPVILITAKHTPAARSKAKRSGAAAYFAKPFQGSALLEVIDGLALSRGSK
jgi:FixJ family two-component response regulator